MVMMAVMMMVVMLVVVVVVVVIKFLRTESASQNKTCKPEHNVPPST